MPETVNTPDADPIRITSITSLLRAIKENQCLLIVDRRDSLHDTIIRSPETAKQVMQPRLVIGKRGDSLQLSLTTDPEIIKAAMDGNQGKMPLSHCSFMDIPKKENFISHDDGSFSILTPVSSRSNEKHTSTYRLVRAGEDYAPSKLLETHPPLAPDVIAQEQREAKEAKDSLMAAQIKGQQEATQLREELKRVSALPHDPGYDATVASLEEVALNLHTDPATATHISKLNTNAYQDVIYGMEEAQALFPPDLLKEGLPLVRLPVLISGTSNRINARMRAEIEIAQKPRGSYVLLETPGFDGKPPYIEEVMISNGDRTVRSVRFTDFGAMLPANSPDLLPTISERYRNYSFYLLRQKTKNTISAQKTISRLSDIDFHKGQVFHDLIIQARKVRKATIVDVIDAPDKDPMKQECHLSFQANKKTHVVRVLSSALVNFISDNDLLERIKRPMSNNDKAQVSLFPPRTPAPTRSGP